MANTMAMSARERLSEYATLKALGFGPGFLAALIFGESLLIALAGGGIGMALLYPAAAGFAAQMGTLFPVFEVAPRTLLMQLLAAVAVGAVAAIAPTIRAVRVNIVDGLRAVA
jgi:putative ABC transport system permease protein